MARAASWKRSSAHNKHTNATLSRTPALCLLPSCITVEPHRNKRRFSKYSELHTKACLVTFPFFRFGACTTKLKAHDVGKLCQSCRSCAKRATHVFLRILKFASAWDYFLDEGLHDISKHWNSINFRVCITAILNFITFSITFLGLSLILGLGFYSKLHCFSKLFKNSIFQFFFL